MTSTFISPGTQTGLIKVARVIRSNQKFTYVNEMECSHDERILASMWLAVAPEKQYTNKDFSASFKEMQEEEL